MTRIQCRAVPGALQLLLAACTAREGERSPPDAGDQRLVVFNAGSLARPLRAALDSFAALEHVTIEQENAGSVETARKVTELEKEPDLVAVADYDVIPNFLMPDHTTWYAQFARNRMVVAYTDRSRNADEMSAERWWQILTRPGVQVGRADPNLDPNGYRTLLVWQLAESQYHAPGLYQRLLARSPAGNVRPKESDLVALLEAGELDYIWSYESIAEAAGFRYVRLPHEIDPSTPADSALYARASVRIAGKTIRDSLAIRGQPIVYAFTVLRNAPHPEVAARFVAYMASPAGCGRCGSRCRGRRRCRTGRGDRSGSCKVSGSWGERTSTRVGQCNRLDGDRSRDERHPAAGRRERSEARHAARRACHVRVVHRRGRGQLSHAR